MSGDTSVFVPTNDVYTFTSYPGPAPESFSSEVISGVSVDNDAYPRTFNFGVKVTIK